MTGAYDDVPFGVTDPDGPSIAGGRMLGRSQLADLPPVRPLVADVLSRPSAAVLVGGYGTGKTFLALGLAACVATGQPWLGHDVEPGRVLYVCGEGAYGIDTRLTAWERTWQHGRPIPDDRLTILAKPVSLTSPTFWWEVTAAAVEGGYLLVILDTLSSLAPDADEVKQAPTLMRQLSDLAVAIDGAAMLVHHPGWSDATRVRGAYAFEANADEVLVLAPVAEGSDVLTLLRKKVKEGPSGATLYLRRVARHAACVIEHARPDDAGVPMRDRVLALLTAYDDVGATGPQLAAACGVGDGDRSALYRALRQLRDDQLIWAEGKRGRERYYIGEQP